MHLEKYQSDGKDYLRLVRTIRVKKENGKALNRKEVVKALGPMSQYDDGKPDYKYNLKAEFVAPRLWMDPRTKDGGFMSTNADDREFAMWRAYRSIDIARELGTDLIVLWLAREGTLCAES